MNFKVHKRTISASDFELESVQKKRSQIIKEIEEIHRKNDSVCGVFLSGTLCSHPRDIYSDLDFITIVDDKDRIEKFIRKNIYETLNIYDNDICTDCDYSDEYGLSTDFYYKDVEVCLVYYSISEIEQKITDFFAGKYEKIGYFYPGATIAAIAENHIIYEEKDVLTTLKNKSQRYSDAMTKRVCEAQCGWANYFIKKFDQFIYRNDSNGLQSNFNNIVDCGLNIIYAINKIPYSGPNKSFDSKIAKFKFKYTNIENDVGIILSGMDNNGIMYNTNTRMEKSINFLSECQNCFSKWKEYNDK